MSTSYPGAIDSFTIPSGTATLGGSTPTHTGVHQNEADAIVAIQTELGTNPKGASASVAARLGTLAVDSAVIHQTGSETKAGDLYLVRSDAAPTQMKVYGLGAQQQALTVGASDTRRFTWLRDASDALFLYHDNAAWGGGFGILMTVRPQGEFGFGTMVAGAGVVQAAGPVRVGQYTVATLPAAGYAGRIVYATNGRKNGEGAGAGTGVQCYDDGTAWRRVSDDSTVAA